MDEGKRSVEAMEAQGPPSPLRGAIQVEAKRACDCGCGAPARVDITILGFKPISLTGPEVVDRMIGRLAEAREAIWGPR